MNALTGTGRLVLLALRRDRVSLPLWIVALSALPAATANAYEQLYPTAASRAPLTGTIGQNPALAVLFGPAYDLSTPGGFTAWRLLGFLCLFVGLMVIFTVTQHTRAEEDAGRHELLASGVVGRYAPLIAAILVAGGASTVIGGLTFVSMWAIGLPVAGAIAFGKALAMVGWVFTGLTAVAAQLMPYARSTNGLACAVLGASYLLRGIGDAAPESGWLGWLSPIGWAQRLRPFAGEQWWVLVLPVVTVLGSIWVASILLGMRDAGAGLWADRAGPATGGRALSGPFGLAWRLQRGTLLGWTAGMLVAGAAFGSAAVGVGELISGNPTMRAIFERMGGSAVLIDSFLGQIAAMFGMVAALYAVQAVLRLRAEEVADRVEPVLATCVGRVRLALSHVVFALVGTGVVLAAGGLGAGLTHGVRVDDVGGYAVRMLGATLVQLPATWVVAGLAAALYGLLPRYSAAAWAVAGAFIGITLFGPVFDLAPTVLNASPFGHVPRLPGTEFDALPLLWLALIAAVSLGVGLLAFRRRDVR